jgi:hypothetical protein
MFRTVSQTRIHYPDSPLSQGTAGDVHGGDRLPWVGPGAENNYLPLQSLDWQAHVYGEVQQDLQIACRELKLPLHRFAWSEGAKDAGIGRDALYVIRPDGYVALASPEQNVSRLRSYVERLRLCFREAVHCDK